MTETADQATMIGENEVIVVPGSTVYHLMDVDGRPACNTMNAGVGNYIQVRQNILAREATMCEQCKAQSKPYPHMNKEDMANAVRDMVGVDNENESDVLRRETLCKIYQRLQAQEDQNDD